MGLLFAALLYVAGPGPGLRLPVLAMAKDYEKHKQQLLQKAAAGQNTLPFKKMVVHKNELVEVSPKPVVVGF